MTDMDLPIALRLVVRERAKIARRYWSTDEYLSATNHSDATRWWIGALLPADFGLPDGQSAYDQCTSDIVALYKVCAWSRCASIDREWSPNVSEVIATDWYVVTDV